MLLRLLLCCCAIFLVGCPGGEDPPLDPPQILIVTPGGIIGLPDDIVTFRVVFSGQVTDYAWSFEGVTPSTSADAAPQVTLGSAGEFQGSVQVQGPTGASEVFAFNYRIGENSAPEGWAAFAVQGPGPTATRVRAALVEDHLLVAYKTGWITGAGDPTDLWIAISSQTRPEAPEAWTTYILNQGDERLGLAAPTIVILNGRPLLSISRSFPESTIEEDMLYNRQRLLWAAVPHPTAREDWQLIELPVALQDMMSVIPLSDGRLGVLGGQSDTPFSHLYWLTTDRLPPTSAADWQMMTRKYNSGERHLMAEVNGGLSLINSVPISLSPRIISLPSASWTHYWTLHPAGFADPNRSDLYNEYGNPAWNEHSVFIGGLVSENGRAVLAVNFGDLDSADQQTGRHVLVTRTIPAVRGPSPGSTFDLLVTGPGEAQMDVGFFQRALLWDHRLLSHYFFDGQLYLIRAMSETPTGLADFESTILTASEPVSYALVVQSTALVPLADGGAAVLTCGRPTGTPRPLEIWYPSGPW